MRATVIIPFHSGLHQLAQSVAAVRQAMPDCEILIAADGAREDCTSLAVQHRARLVEIPGPAGPATARNRAADVATGDVLFFVDSDVVAGPEALPGMYALLARDEQIAGVFGAYDLAPAASNFMSQYRNLSHAYVHELGRPEAKTFWAGLGAIRTHVFRAVGGFDERFRRPSVEDIDLGYRVTAVGHRLRLDPSFRGTHLKRWTLRNGIATDIFARGIPWTQLIRRYRVRSNDLNLSAGLRLSVIASYALAATLLAAIVAPIALVVAALAVGGLLSLNWRYYQWFAERRGLWFACRVVPVHVLHHLCNGVSFGAGTLLYFFDRVGWRLPGALPRMAWPARAR